MASSLLVMNLGLLAIVANLETQRGIESPEGLATWRAFELDEIFSEFSSVMTAVGFASYLLLIFHLFLLPDCPSMSDLLTLFNVG